MGFWGQLKWERGVGEREGEKGEGAECFSGGLGVKGWHGGQRVGGEERWREKNVGLTSVLIARLDGQAERT